MTSPEPRDEPSLRPPQDPASPPAEPDAARAEQKPPGAEPPRRATPFGEPVDPFHVDDGGARPSSTEERPSPTEEHPSSTEERPSSEEHPATEEHPSPAEEKPRPTTEYTRPSHPRTEQMRRNTEYAERQHAEEAPKPGPKDAGKYKGEVPPLTLPPDPLRPYSSGFVKRKRRPEWPVLVFALVVVAVVVVGCCLSGFALFSVWHPFTR